ncbi:MAG: cephalosporin hydroxylase family protein [Dokdonella sp.]
MSAFEEETRERLRNVHANSRLLSDARAFTESSVAARYSYNFLWQGRPIIQYPQDMVAMQELVWATRPDLIIETGIAHGGSLVLSASLLTMLDYADAATNGQLLDPRAPRRRVLGIDIDIREHNREAILAHPLAGRIDMLQGSSIDPDIIAQVAEIARGFERVMVCLDSNHTHDHVLAELQAYAPLVSPGGYCVVFDTVIEELPNGACPDRPWDIGNNPRTAVKAYLATHAEFLVDEDIEAKLLITVAPGGYLRRLNPA